MYPDPWNRHALLLNGVRTIDAFIRAPGVPGILPLAAVDTGVYFFQGDGIAAAELLGTAIGEKAALELFASGCQAIQQALGAAGSLEIPSHGALSPWRIVLGPRGQVHLLGFGVPPVEALAWLDEEIQTIGIDSLRFFPPERLEDRGEDGRSDLFALALVAAELATGKPVLGGALNAVLDAIYDGKVGHALEATCARLRPDVVELFSSAVAHRIADRPADLEALAKEALTLARTAPGRPLVELAQRRAPIPDEGPTDAPPTNAQTEVVDVSAILRASAPEHAPTEMVNLADTLIAAQGLIPPPRSSEDYEPELTELVPATTDEAPLPPPIPELASSADLPGIRLHASASVARAELLAALAGRASEAVATAAGISEADRIAADAEAGRARKAASTARSSAGLLELDDEVEGARITVNLVVRAEQQAERATLRVQALAADVLRRGRAARAAQEAKKRAEAQAERHVEAAYAAAEQADTAAKRLEARREANALAQPEALAALSRAWQQCQLADEAAGEAETALAALRAGEAHGTTLERARAAQQTAERARTAVLEAIRAAEQAELDGARRVASDAVAEAERAQDAAGTARAAAERAHQAAAHVPADAEAKEAAQATKIAAEEAQEAAGHAAAAAKRAQSSTDSAATQTALTEARTAADKTVAAATRAREAAEKVARRAGAAAEKAAKLSGLREQATLEVAKLTRVLTRQREQVAETEQELTGVNSPGAKRRLARAHDVCDALEHAIAALQQQAAAVPDDAGLRAVATQVTRLAQDDELHGLLDGARSDANQELEAIREARARAEALGEARATATAHARTCRELVDQAATSIRSRVAELTRFGLSPIDQRTARALEILDIAEFQAGEAEQSAAWANEEADPTEASAHAETAASFAVRIGLDLPEANAVLQEAESIAEEMRAVVKAAKGAASALAAELEASVGRSREVAAAARAEAADAPGPVVARNQAMLLEALAEVEEAHTAAAAATDGVQSAGDPEEAEHKLEAARQATARVAGLEANVRDRADALFRVTALAMEGQRALEKAQAEARTWAEQSVAARDAAEAAAAEAKAAIDEHQAVQQAATAALEQASRAAAQAATAAREAQSALQTALASQEAADADAAASLVEDALERAERGRELAQEAARTAQEAAQTERRERDAARDRKISAARDLASTHAQTAREIADRLIARRNEVASQLKGVVAPVAQAEADAAGRATEICTDAATAAEEALRVATEAPDAGTAENAAQDAQAEATRAQHAAAKAESLLQRAVDHAREATEEAEALKQVVDEARGSVGRAALAVERAKEEAREILQLKLGLEAKKELASRIRDEIDSAEKALKKVEATAPLAVGSTDLGTAQALLATCRATVARAEGRADAVRDLVAEAARAVAEEADRRAQALASARLAAKAPAVRARDAATQARGWLESARRIAGDVPPAQAEIAKLEAKTATLAALAAAAGRAAEGVDDLGDTEAIQRTSDRVAGEVVDLEQTLAAAQRARDAVEAIVAAETARASATREALEAADPIREPAREVASRARAAVEELESWLNTGEDAGEAARLALAEAEAAAVDARAAIDALDALFEHPPADPSEIPQTAQAQLQRAIAGLEAVVAGDASAREAASQYRQVRAEAARKAEEERRQQKEAAAKAEEQNAQKKADGRETKRLSRLEERRQRFLDRRGMSDSHSKPPQEEEAEQEDDEANDPARKVRQWQRGKTQATEGSTRSRARPRPSERPAASRPEPPSQSGADALLQRLRDRQNRRDED